MSGFIENIFILPKSSMGILQPYKKVGFYFYLMEDTYLPCILSLA